MEKSKIIESLKLYFERSSTDYAVMINGEWGVGKTYFLKKEVFKLIKDLKLRTIYISLIGLNNDAQLEKLIFQKVNPFYHSNNKSSIASESDYIEAIINGEDKLDINIPENIVLCFDDLERIRPEFFETAMGFINVFIEHYKTKCIFICNEPILEKVKINYQTVKEKYIRFCYSFSPILETVIEEKISSIKSEHKVSYNIPLIVSVFNKGENNNLRTLFFVLSIFEQVLNEIDKFQDRPQNYGRIIDLILSFCCFYTIESKKGIPYSLLDKITIANTPGLGSNWFKDEEIIGLTLEKSNQEEKETSDDNSADLQKIQERYFDDTSFQFERFESVAGLIKNGYLDTEMLKNEIITLERVISKNEKGNKEIELLNKILNVFELSDSELVPTVNLIIKEAENGIFNLQNYLKIYSELVLFESLGIKGIKISEEVTKKFEVGVDKASKSGELRFIPNLLFQVQWNKDDKSEYAAKYNSFASYVDSINKKLNDKKDVAGFTAILMAIKENRHEELYALLNKEDTIVFTKKDSREFYDLLIKANAKINDNFLNGLKGRYSNSGSFISQMPKLEEGFIIGLFELLNNDKNLKLEIEKPLSMIPLVFLKDYLESLIKKNLPK